MTKLPKEEQPCPFCKGTGKYSGVEDPRCPQCRGAGILADSPQGNKVYCSCQMGIELKRMDQRIADERAWNLAQQPTEPLKSTADRLHGLLNSVQFKPEEES